MNPIYGNSGFPQPLLILLQCNPPRLALRLFLSGLFSPGVERGGGELSGLRPGEALFVFPAVDFEDFVILLALRPVDKGANPMSLS